LSARFIKPEKSLACGGFPIRDSGDVRTDDLERAAASGDIDDGAATVQIITTNASKSRSPAAAKSLLREFMSGWVKGKVPLVSERAASAGSPAEGIGGKIGQEGAVWIRRTWNR